MSTAADVPFGVPTIAAHDDDELAAVAILLGNAGTRLDGIALIADPTVPAGLVRFHVPPFDSTLTPARRLA